MLGSIVALALAPAAADAARTCGALDDGDAPRQIRAAHVECRGARRLAEAHWLLFGRFDACAPRRGTCRVRGYRCVWRGNDRVVCRAGARRVTFAYAR